MTTRRDYTPPDSTDPQFQPSADAPLPNAYRRSPDSTDPGFSPASDTPRRPLADPPAATAKEVKDAAAQVNALEAELAAAKETHAALTRAHAAPPMPFKSDEGISVALAEAGQIVNLSDQDGDTSLDARRFELHVAGKVFTHVGENAKKQWLYRSDK